MKSKKNLFEKLSKLRIQDLKRLDLEKSEIEYIKRKLLNDNIGLKLNYTEFDDKLDKNYVIFTENKNLGINVKRDIYGGGL